MQKFPKRLAADLLEFIDSAWLAVSPKVKALAEGIVVIGADVTR